MKGALRPRDPEYLLQRLKKRGFTRGVWSDNGNEVAREIDAFCFRAK
jgi:hypothetical protein